MPDDKNVFASVSRYAGMAMILPASMAVGYAIGYGLDRLFGTRFLYIVFLLLGIVAGFVSLFRQLNEQMKRDES